MNVNEVMQELEAFGNEQTRKTWANHGGVQPFFGVRIGDMKTILKKTKTNHALALELWDTGNSDARYLAALMADPKKFTTETLERWAREANWVMLSQYSVPWVAAEGGQGWTLGLRWIEDPSELVAVAGWCSLAGHITLTPDAKLDIPAIHALLDRCQATLHQERNRVRYNMNSFVIAAACYVAPVREHAIAVANAVGKVHVDMGDTYCQVPFAPAYIEKVLARAPDKRKKLRC